MWHIDMSNFCSSFKVSSHQVDKKWGFCSKASPRQMIITLRILHRFFQDWKFEKLWHWGVRPCRQKFLPLLDHRNFWTFRIFSKFFSEKSIFQDFDVRFFCGRGCAMTKIFFWGDRLFLEVKPRGRRKSRTGPPRGVINNFSSLRESKTHFQGKTCILGTKFLIFMCLFDGVSLRGLFRSQ